MDISIFLARLLGLYLVIVGIACFFKREFFREVLRDFFKNPSLIAVASIINLFIGLLIVLNHNIWEFSWKMFITIIGYLSLLKGIFHLYAPEWGKKMAVKSSEWDIFVYSGVISLALGLYLMYHGFFEIIQEMLALT